MVLLLASPALGEGEGFRHGDFTMVMQPDNMFLPDSITYAKGGVELLKPKTGVDHAFTSFEFRTKIYRNENRHIYVRLDKILAAYPAAVARLQRLAAEAGDKQDEAATLATLAQLKLLAAQVLDFLMRDNGDKTALKQAVHKLKPALDTALQRSFEPVGVERMTRAWREPRYAALK